MFCFFILDRTPIRRVRLESRIPVSVTNQLFPSPSPQSSAGSPDVNTTNTSRRILFNDNVPVRGNGGTASIMRYRIGRGYRHAQQLRTPTNRTLEVEHEPGFEPEIIDITAEE